MSDKMLKFVNIGQQNPPKRSIDERNKDFKEIYREFIDEKAKTQDRKSTRLNSSHSQQSRMPSSA